MYLFCRIYRPTFDGKANCTTDWLIITCGCDSTLGKCGVDTILRDSAGREHPDEVVGVDVSPARRVRTLLGIDVDGDAAGEIVSAVIEAAGDAEWM